MTVHRTALVLVVTLCLGLFDHYWFHGARSRSRRKRLAQMTLGLLSGCLHCKSQNRTCRRRLAANLRAFELAANRTSTPERARIT